MGREGGPPEGDSLEDYIGTVVPSRVGAELAANQVMPSLRRGCWYRFAIKWMRRFFLPWFVTWKKQPKGGKRKSEGFNVEMEVAYDGSKSARSDEECDPFPQLWSSPRAVGGNAVCIGSVRTRVRRRTSRGRNARAHVFLNSAVIYPDSFFLSSIVQRSTTVSRTSGSPGEQASDETAACVRMWTRSAGVWRVSSR